MTRKRRGLTLLTQSVDSAITDAFADAETIKEELEQWRDALPPNLQNGATAEKLNDAIAALEEFTELEVPERIKNMECTIQPLTSGKPTRRKRLNQSIAWLEEAAGAARVVIEDLEALGYDYDGNLDDEEPRDEDPKTEDARDEAVGELESFANDCDEVVSKWGEIEFPGMYGVNT